MYIYIHTVCVLDILSLDLIVTVFLSILISIVIYDLVIQLTGHNYP